ncbi:TetR/AcrR family transcriptional regulator [Advenella sp. FME57]|uniref:TetR/AcrR family transcriptional regulator n=1 Tax=Advenella sp. FME57 TaxID=2742604 RepID=UPI0018664819|nr:TetR/AcrR family transcriptional regulator [Advenella sp. FME57]
MNVELSLRATEIAEHTKQLPAAGGYNGFSYADISDRVHIGKASIHHHFPSKADLVHTVVVRHREQAREGLAALDRHINNPLAELKAYTDYWAKCIGDGTTPICVCAMLAAELPMIPQEIADEVRGYFEELTNWLEAVLDKGAKLGQFHLQESAFVEAQTFLSMVHGAMLTARVMNNSQAFEAISHAALSRLTAST